MFTNEAKTHTYPPPKLSQFHAMNIVETRRSCSFTDNRDVTGNGVQLRTSRRISNVNHTTLHQSVSTDHTLSFTMRLCARLFLSILLFHPFLPFFRSFLGFRVFEMQSRLRRSDPQLQAKPSLHFIAHLLSHNHYHSSGLRATAGRPRQWAGPLS